MLVLMNIEAVLKDHGCTRITAASTVEQALAAISTQSFDCAVLDVNLGGITSHSVAEELCARAIPFVISSGYGQLDGNYKNQSVLMKPYPDEALLKALTQQLGR